MAFTSIFADAFTRADSATVDNGWIEGTAAVFEILSNACKATGNVAGFADNMMRAPSSGNFQDGKAVVEWTHTAGALPQIYIRFDATADSGYLLYWNTTLRMESVTAGALSSLGTATAGITVGDSYRFTFEIEGNNKTGILYNITTSTTIATITESTNSDWTASGHCGLSIHDSGTATFDNFESFVVSNGVITTSPIKNYSGTLQTNKTGWIANVYNKTTGALVVRKTSQTTDASGIMVITDPLIVTGTNYRVDIDDASTLFGNKEYTAT